MAPGRVFAFPPGGSERLLETEEPVAPPRVTRQKAKEIGVTNREKSPLRQDVQSSIHMDDGFVSMDEGGYFCVDLSPNSRFVDRDADLFEEDMNADLFGEDRNAHLSEEPLDRNANFHEEPDHCMNDEGKF